MIAATSIVIATALALYFLLPATVVAFKHEHQQPDAIVVLNLVLGWTFVAWMAALAWVMLVQ
jgi:hypothetical protein